MHSLPYHYNSTLTLHFKGHFFPVGPGLANTRMSPFWILMELWAMEVVSGDNRSCKTCKAPVKSSPPINSTPSFLQARCPSCHPLKQWREISIISSVKKSSF